MKKFILFLAIVGCVAAPLSALAQNRGGGGQGFGGGRMGGMRNSTPAGLLRRDDVQADLGLSETQKTKLKEINDLSRQAMRDAFQNGDRDPKAMEDMRKATEDKQMAVLDAKQKGRLREIWIQISGSTALFDEKLQEELGFTAEQKKKVSDLKAKQEKDATTLMEKMRDEDADRQALMEEMRANGETIKNDLEKVMTPEQKTKLKELGGKPFKATDQPRTPGGRGGGGIGF
jgi:Spy/CpxP family protein refolding chaperone